MKTIIAAVALTAFAGTAATDHPTAEITNGLVTAKIYLPETQRGFYQGTRFDWSGVVYSLKANGHDYYGPWFTKFDPTVHDFVYRDSDIVAGPCSAITGPVDEFAPLGYDDAKAGSTFVKIGVGALRKPDDAKYDNYHLYEIADGGKWKVQKSREQLQLTQQLDDANSGYGYTYTKTLRLTPKKTEMVLLHSLKNTGKRAMQTTVYNHNFLVLDGAATAQGVTITVPFAIQSARPPKQELAEIQDHEIRYLKTLTGPDVVATPLQGFGPTADDNQARIESSTLGAGISLKSNRPLLRESLWSIRSVLAVEPFISITIEPGAEFTWTTAYEYYTLKTKTRSTTP